MTMRVHVHPGELPAFWDRSVVFLANLQGLFFGNEAQTAVLRQAVGKLHTYGGRLVPILNLLFKGPCNRLILERPACASLMVYFEEELGLSLPEMAYLDYQRMQDRLERNSMVQRLRACPADWLDGFVTDDHLSMLAHEAGKTPVSSPSGSRRGNDKTLQHSYWQEAGDALPHTCLAGSRSELKACLSEMVDRGYQRAVVKSAIGASGIGMVQVELEGPFDAEEVPGHLFHEGACLVQGWLEKGQHGISEMFSPSVQVFISDQGVHLYDLTEQVLSHDKVHQGNYAPPDYLPAHPDVRERILEIATRSALWLAGQGYRGTASLDCLVVVRPDQVEVMPCEINARVTGATYPSVLARHFMPRGVWAMRNIRFAEPRSGERVMQDLKATGRLYRPGQDTGILPVNLNQDPEGMSVKGQFLYLAGEDCPNCLEAFYELINVMPMEWSYDRD